MSLKEAQEKLAKLHIYVNDVGKVQQREQLAEWAVANHPELNVLVRPHLAHGV